MKNKYSERELQEKVNESINKIKKERKKNENEKGKETKTKLPYYRRENG